MKLLTDFKHWIGWLLTTGAVIGVYRAFGYKTLYTPWYNVLLLLFVVVVIDYIKHKIDLQ